jgi:D-alanine--poly(phosphoribitol) ligase subunit 2
MDDQLTALIQAAVEEMNATLERPISADADAPLFGMNGVLDSIGLISLVMIVEQRVDDVFGVTISLASEKAMSQTKSPFRTIRSLTDWTKTCVLDARTHGN